VTTTSGIVSLGCDVSPFGGVDAREPDRLPARSSLFWAASSPDPAPPPRIRPPANGESEFAADETVTVSNPLSTGQ
jgi:hypothetical protein